MERYFAQTSVTLSTVFRFVPFLLFIFLLFCCSAFKCSSHVFNILLTLGLEAEWIHFSWNKVEKKLCLKMLVVVKHVIFVWIEKKRPQGLFTWLTWSSALFEIQRFFERIWYTAFEWIGNKRLFKDKQRNETEKALESER